MRAYLQRPSVRRENRLTGLAEALAYLRANDTLVVEARSAWPFDEHLIEKIGELTARGVGFRSLTEKIDAYSTVTKLFADGGYDYKLSFRQQLRTLIG